VIHRDVKPDNIIRRKSDNKLVLVDFGAVKQVRNQTAMGQQKMLSATIAIGTPGYMPSEQAIGKPKPSSDIYALGVIAIQALTGLSPSPQQEDTDTGFRYDHNTGELVWQDKVQVSANLAAILTKMVKFRSQERYTSAVEALQALDQLQSGYTPTVQVTSPSYQPTVQVTPQPTRPVHAPTVQVSESVSARNQQNRPTAPQVAPRSSSGFNNPVIFAGVLLFIIGVVSVYLLRPQSTVTSPQASSTSQQTVPKSPESTSVYDPKIGVTEYYKLINNRQIDQAFQMLTPEFQNDKAKGYKSYSDWWLSLDSVGLEIINSNWNTGTATVDTNLTYFRNGKPLKTEFLRPYLRWNDSLNKWQIYNSEK
jgi:serine/threonine protein kinase